MKEITAPHKGTLEWPYLAGDGGGDNSDAIQDSDNQDFADGTINEWVVSKRGGAPLGTLDYDGNDLGFTGDEPGDHKQAKLTSSGDDSLFGSLPTSGNVTLTANKLHRLKAVVAVGAANTYKTVRLRYNSIAGDVPGFKNFTIGG